MDCNKEEAIRAKGVAEKKMQNKDFVGAWKIALRAQQLYPELDNIIQMLTVCEVHCSAEHKVLASEMDWYSILQTTQTADAASMKKQYRKLALLLHPDKNKFEGAEAAFKLVGEAQRVLLDPMKRSIYDMKYNAFLRTTVSKQSQQQQTRNSNARKQSGVNVTVNAFPKQFTSMNFHQQYQKQQQQKTQSVGPNGQETFWTACPSCNIRYQYLIEVLNRCLRCPSCNQPFTAYNLNAQGVQPGASWTQSAVPQQNGVFNEGVHKMNSQNNVQNNPSNMGFQGPGCGPPTSEPFPKAGGTSEVGQEPKSKSQEDMKVDGEVGKKGKRKSRTEDENLKTSRKKANNLKAESSESCSLNTDSDEDEITEEGEKHGFPAAQNVEGRYPRRSVRSKQNYNENLSDDDFVSPLKRAGGSGSANVTNDQNKASFSGDGSKTTDPMAAVLEKEKEVKKQNRCAPLKESLANGNIKAEKCKQNGQEAAAVEGSVSDSKFSSNASSKRKPDPEFFVVPDSDFYDFDKDRKEECFACDQLWALYDTIDGMPRFYARISKVFTSGFRVRITWLEADPDDADEIYWLDEDLPVTCGKFKHGNSENTEDINMFSHLVYEKSPSRGSYRIYPKMGETWALFKNWDKKWSSDPENHRSYEFEFVVVLSDSAERSSVRVAYLVKVKGFVSLFGVKKGMSSFEIPLNELLRFSHRIPSYKTTGAERKGLSGGYFELDPASLPDKIEEIADPKDVEVATTNMNSKIDNSSESPDAMESGCSPNIVTEDYCDNPSPSSLDPAEIPFGEFYDFEADRTLEKLKLGQIWALYCEIDGMPKYYARIDNIGPTSDVKLSITWLEPDQPPKDIIQWFEKEMPICCGVFKCASAKEFIGISSLSHIPEVKTSGRNKFEIIPRKGEIWALYKNFNSEWTCSDLVKCEYDIVEVIENTVKMTKVMVLELVDGFDTVFRAPGTVVSTLEIPQVEIVRFSHKVPAFQLTSERDGTLKGFWELDPKSTPYCFIRSS